MEKEIKSLVLLCIESVIHHKLVKHPKQLPHNIKFLFFTLLFSADNNMEIGYIGPVKHYDERNYDERNGYI